MWSFVADSKTIIRICVQIEKKATRGTDLQYLKSLDLIDTKIYKTCDKTYVHVNVKRSTPV